MKQLHKTFENYKVKNKSIEQFYITIHPTTGQELALKSFVATQSIKWSCHSTNYFRAILRPVVRCLLYSRKLILKSFSVPCPYFYSYSVLRRLIRLKSTIRHWSLRQRNGMAKPMRSDGHKRGKKVIQYLPLLVYRTKRQSG